MGDWYSESVKAAAEQYRFDVARYGTKKANANLADYAERLKKGAWIDRGKFMQAVKTASVGG